MPMYNLEECSNKYSKTSGRSWQYHRDELNATLADSESLNLKYNQQEPPLALVMQRMLK